MTTEAHILERLGRLTPVEFENLTFDLVAAAGMRNPVWRTPGSDGGRDIEGEFGSVDFSGHHDVARWYVECKRYGASVDWPTVWEKIAYADNHEADYLLVVTNAFLSPQCKTEISSWNTRRSKPKIRFWDASNLISVLRKQSGLLLKYRLTDDPAVIPPSFLYLAQCTSKVVQAAYGTAELRDQENAALEAASALAEILTVQMEYADQGRSYDARPFTLVQDHYQWLALQGDLTELERFDRYGLRTILAVFRYVSAAKIVIADVCRGEVIAKADGGHPLNATAVDLLFHVAIWSHVEIHFSGSSLRILERKSDES